MKVSALTDIKAAREYLNRVGAEARGMRTAVVREIQGKYWRDICKITFAKDGEVAVANQEFAPNEIEEKDIKAEFRLIEWPELKLLSSIINAPDAIQQADPKDIFEFRNLDGMIVMVQVRLQKGSERAYVPYTYWDDDKWRTCEPEGQLPLYNLPSIKGYETVFIHEGAKAARHCAWMAEGKTKEARDALAAHPWGKQIAGAAHVGWIGGALSPHRTNWKPLKANGIKTAYIIADNDEPGKAAVSKISHKLHMVTWAINFGMRFPPGFDLADPFPEHLFNGTNGNSVYVGPTFRAATEPATWATDPVPTADGKGRPSYKLRDHFNGLWGWVEESDSFVCMEMPDIIKTESILNKILASYSDVMDTCRLIYKHKREAKVKLCYRPDVEERLINLNDRMSVNLHTPGKVISKAGDASLWNEYLAYMFPVPDERKEVERWIATLIARPGVRMGYGLLLITETQGIGKTTLGMNILRYLVGEQNTSFPSEASINSAFNTWIAQKRLCVVNEIYSGRSWHAYNTLKSAITDPIVTVNKKFQTDYEIENWCHFIACSNSRRALKVENDDRRWFYPTMPERRWPDAKFQDLYDWIARDGLSIIKHWAENYGDYVHTREIAPMTANKREMIEGSRSEAAAEAAALAEAMNSLEGPCAVAMKDLEMWCRSQAQGKVFDSGNDLRKAMRDKGVTTYDKRIKVGARLQHVMINQKMVEMIRAVEPSDNLGEELFNANRFQERINQLIRKYVVRCSEIMEVAL